jgi:hypothetical protein
MRTPCVALALFFTVTMCLADNLVINVGGLTGTYMSGATRSATAVFDANQLPHAIAGITLKLQGSVTPGLACYVDAPLNCINLWPYIDTAMNPTPTCKWSGGPTKNSSYTINLELPYSPGNSCSGYDFLRDGQESVSLHHTSGVIIGIFTVRYQPIFSITSAQLIVKETIAITAPSASQLIPAHSNFVVTWRDTRTAGVTGYSIDLSHDGGESFEQIGQVQGNPGSFLWTTPDIDSNNCMLRITDADNPAITDTSSIFYLYQCNTPNQGDINDDCYVTAKDFALLASAWLNTCGADNCEGADIDSSSRVDLLDLRQFALNWLVCWNHYDAACGSP